MRIAGKTQVEVSAGTGLSQGFISKIAAPRDARSQRLTLKASAKLAAFFHCQIADLFPRETAVEVEVVSVEVIRHAS